MESPTVVKNKNTNNNKKKKQHKNRYFCQVQMKKKKDPPTDCECMNLRHEYSLSFQISRFKDVKLDCIFYDTVRV